MSQFITVEERPFKGRVPRPVNLGFSLEGINPRLDFSTKVH